MYLQWPRLAVGLSLAGLLDELAEELVLQLWVGQAHLQGTLGQGHVIVDGRRVDGHVDEELAGLSAAGHKKRKREVVGSFFK